MLSTQHFYRGVYSGFYRGVYSGFYSGFDSSRYRDRQSYESGA
jgi:hypothetical protein